MCFSFLFPPGSKCCLSLTWTSDSSSKTLQLAAAGSVVNTVEYYIIKFNTNFLIRSCILYFEVCPRFFPWFVFNLLRFLFEFESLRNSDPGQNSGVFVSNAKAIAKNLENIWPKSWSEILSKFASACTFRKGGVQKQLHTWRKPIHTKRTWNSIARIKRKMHETSVDSYQDEN